MNKFIVRFAKLTRYYAVDKAPNGKTVRDRFSKWRDDVIVNSVEEKAFDGNDLLNVALGKWTVVTLDQIKDLSNTIKTFVLELPDKSNAFEIQCHPDDLEKAIKEYTSKRKGFLITIGSGRFFVERKGITTVPIYTVKTGKFKEAPKAITEGALEPDEMHLHEERENLSMGKETLASD
jgi:hypothetical protein